MRIVNDRITVPFDIGQCRIFSKQVVQNLENKILHLGICQIQDQLISEVMFFTLWLFDDPIRMLLVEFGFGANHFGFYPDSEFNALLGRFFHECCDTIGQFCPVRLPIS
ncbi:hypothetical protein D3C80_851040 [compost metagenome]